LHAYGDDRRILGEISRDPGSDRDFSDYQKNDRFCSYFVLDGVDRTSIIAGSRIGERALSRTSRGGVGCDGTVAAAEAPGAV